MGLGSKRNLPCWCRSGKKYKNCHLGREDQPRRSVSEALEHFRRAHRPRACLHPSASPVTCCGPPISSHSIQRRGSLASIATNGHVLGFRADFGQLNETGGRIEPLKIGLKNASTFPGFCATHDRATFDAIERTAIAPTTEQGFLLAYRAVCKELFQKRAQLDVMTEAQATGDHGLSPLDQLRFQSWVSSHLSGVRLGLRDLGREKSLHDAILLNRTWDQDYCFVAVPIASKPTIVSSGAVIPEHDFAGNSLAKLGRSDLECDLLAFSIVATDHDGVALWACRRDSEHGMSFLRQAATLSDEELLQGAVRFAFELVENTFMTPDWWSGLAAEKKEVVIRRANSGLPFGPDPGPEQLRDDGVRLVDWSAGSRIVRVDGQTR